MILAALIAFTLTTCNGQEPGAATLVVSVPAVPQQNQSIAPVGDGTPPPLPADSTNVPGCSVGQLRETSHVKASEINGGNTGAFVRESTCPGYKSISSRVTLPIYQTQPAQTDQPWIYFGMNDGSTDIELGFAFEMGAPNLNPPPRWLPYVRKGSTFKYGTAITPGSTVDVQAFYVPGAGHLLVNGVDVLNIPVTLSADRIQVRRVVGIAVRDEDFDGDRYRTLSLQNVIWQNTLVTSTSGQSLELKNVPLDAQHVDGHWYGTVWWPSERITYQQSGAQDSISILSESAAAAALATSSPAASTRR